MIITPHHQTALQIAFHIFTAIGVVILHIIGQILATIIIIKEHRTWWKSAFWIGIVWLIPYLGPSIYLLCGWQWKGKLYWLIPLYLVGGIIAFIHLR